MGGGQSDGENDAIRAEPVIRYLANAELTDPLWRDPRVEPSIFPGPYRVLYEAMVLAWQQELPRTAAIIARGTLELGTPLSESDIESIIRDAEYVDADGVAAQIQLLVQERDRKALVTITTAALRDMSTPGVDATVIRADLGDFCLNGMTTPVTVPRLSDVGKDADAELAASRGLDGLSSGIRSLDRITNGFPSQSLVIIAARVSVGKSALAMQLAELYVKQKRRVAYFSLELTRKMFVRRWIVQTARISYTGWQSNSLTPDEVKQKNQAIAALASTEDFLTLYACGELREQTRNTIIQLVMREPRDRRPEVIIVDLITNLQPLPSERTMPAWDRWDRETDGLRKLAAQANATVFGVCQLNRELTKRKDKRPQLSDIRSSGAIEQNADQVILMHNPEIIGVLESGERLSDQQQLFLHVNKNRNGGPGTAEVIWQADSLTIRDKVFSPATFGGSTTRNDNVDDLWGRD